METVEWSKYIQRTVGMFTDTWEPVKTGWGRQPNYYSTMDMAYCTAHKRGKEKKKRNIGIAI